MWSDCHKDKPRRKAACWPQTQAMKRASGTQHVEIPEALLHKFLQGSWSGRHQRHLGLARLVRAKAAAGGERVDGFAVCRSMKGARMKSIRERRVFLSDMAGRRARHATQRHTSAFQPTQKHTSISVGSETDSCTRNSSLCKPTCSVAH